MRRVLYTLIAGAAIAGAVPATALAEGHDRGHRRDNERQHRHHVRIHHRHFGRIEAPLRQDIGTVASFDGRTLAIRLNNGSTVSGAVNRDTEIRCAALDRGFLARNDDHGGGGGPGDSSGSSGGPGDSSGSSGDRGNDRGDDRGDDNDNDRNDDNDMRNCGLINLRPGTVVHDADLRFSPVGPIWQEVELVVRSPRGLEH